MSRKSISAEVLKALMSPERLGSYEQEMGSPAAAVALYEWNLAMRAALFESLGTVEVILRNAFHRELALRHAREVAPDPGTRALGSTRRVVETSRPPATGQLGGEGSQSWKERSLLSCRSGSGGIW